MLLMLSKCSLVGCPMQSLLVKHLIVKYRTICYTPAIILFMLSGQRHARQKSSTSRPQCSVSYNLKEPSHVPAIRDIGSNGHPAVYFSSSSNKKTTQTDASFIKCKRISSKGVNLRTQPHHQYKKIHHLQEKYISARNKGNQTEQDHLAQTINFTNRNCSKHKYIVTQVFNSTGKQFYQTECKCKYLDDLLALQSKTTTRKARKQSQPYIATQSQGHSRMPSFHLKSPQKQREKNKKNIKTTQKDSATNKKLAVAPSKAKSERKIKHIKPNLHLNLQKIEKRMIAQALQLSYFSYGQHSKSEPDLYQRVAQSEQISTERSSKQTAANTIKKHWKQFKKRSILQHYKSIFDKVEEHQNSIPSFRQKQKKGNKNVPTFNLADFESTLKEKTISEHLNEDLEMDFNVNKYVSVEPRIQEEEEGIDQVKKKNKQLEKELLIFKEKQLNLCEKFQNVLLSSQENIKAEELLELIKTYKAEVTMDKKPSENYISYKELVEQKGIASKIVNGRNPAIKAILDDEQNLLKHKINSSKNLAEDPSLKSITIVQQKEAAFTPETQKQQESEDINSIETNKLMSIYLDCELGNISYQKELREKELQVDQVKNAINRIEAFNNEEAAPIQRLKISKQMMYELAKTQEFQWQIETFLMDQFCEEVERSPSIIQNLHYIREIQAYNQSLQIKISLPDVIEYLKGFVQHIFRNKKVVSMLLENINKPLGSSSAELLYYLRVNTDRSFEDYTSQNPYHFIIPMGMFEEYENINRPADLADSQEGLIIHYFWHRALYEVFNELLDRKRPYGLQGKPYAWNTNLFQNFGSINFERLTKIFQLVLSQTLEILTFPAGLMFDSPLCQYYGCELSEENQNKINQERLWLIICEQIVDDEPIYHNYDDQVAEVLLEIASHIQDKLLYESVVDLRKLSGQRFLLSLSV